MIPLYSPLDRFLARVCFLLVAAAPAIAQSSAWNDNQVEVEAIPWQPVVVTGSRLQVVGEVAAEQVGLFALREGQFVPIPFQIDRRDAEGRYRLGDDEPQSSAPVDDNDELVFLARDAGGPLASIPEPYRSTTGTGIAVHSTEGVRWVYVLALSEPVRNHSETSYVRYDAGTDTISTAAYRVGFSKEHPFLIDRLHWAEGVDRWGPNLADTMKVRHLGKLFGFVDFKRTQADYRSNIIAVKAGPVRVIRRTRNSVYMLLGLHTPSLYIDFVADPNYMVMDTIIDLPFSLGLFFDDLKTLNTMDWRDNAATQGMRLRSVEHPAGAAVDGVMSAEDRTFATSDMTDYEISSSGGAIRVGMEVDDTLPIEKHLYLVDDRAEPDPPENVPGQFGNSGYLTTEWEEVSRGVHHIRFHFALIPYAVDRPAMELSGLTGRPGLE